MIRRAWSDLTLHWKDSAKGKYEAGYIDNILHLIKQVDSCIEEIERAINEAQHKFNNLV